MKDSTNMVNWENVFEKSDSFKNNPDFQFTFVENFFQKDFYEKLFSTYPEFNDGTWITGDTMNKKQLVKPWANLKPEDKLEKIQDSSVSEAWNNFKLYVESDEFLSNMREFTGVKINKLKVFGFYGYEKGGFQMPHAHNVGPSTLIMMLYFSKGWKNGQPGGTFMAKDYDESSIIFEPYNLDNSMAIFHDAPNAIHGVRRLTEDVQRKAVQICLEEYSEKDGWSGWSYSDVKKEELPEL
ncbi:MAG: hypothetical protein CMA31_07460 [Euryarchaeota archaeon]|nr:hypothetical protein [Euryarchaeota archaeon]